MDAKQAPAAQVAAGATIYVSAGVKTILQAGAGETAKPDAPVQLRGPDYWPFVRALLVITDLLLVGLCGLLAWRAAGAMTVWEALGCTLAVSIGAALTCACVLVGTDNSPLHLNQSVRRRSVGRTHRQ